MKWYKYKEVLINLDRIYRLDIPSDDTGIVFSFSKNDWEFLNFTSEEERDAEYEKIKYLLGIED